MGQQQLLLILLGILIIGVAIAAALGLFGSEEINANKQAMIHDMLNIASFAKRYYIRPVSMGGGSRSFVGFTIPAKVQSTPNGSYSVGSSSATDITLVGVSASHAENTMSVVLNSQGKLSSWTFTGDFQ
jgi:hypothetical protein